MSKAILQGGASGAGSVTLLAPNTASTQTLTLPDSTGTLATSASTLTQFNASGSAPVYATRAWCNFNGTGTVAIRASGNVSSITDNGVGIYTVNFTTAMSDANYVTNVTGMEVTNGGRDGYAAIRNDGSYVAGSVKIFTSIYNTYNPVDYSMVCVSVFR
jgi:hypothetical protein